MTFILLVSVLFTASAQDSAAEPEDHGRCDPNLDRVAVPSPTRLLDQVRSAVPQARVAALKLVGVTLDFAALRRQSGEDWTKASQTRLLFGRYQTDGDLAVIAVQIKPYLWAGVLVRERTGWKWIAVVQCWCKYEADPLFGFIELRQILGSQTDILVHESGGGTGIYSRSLSMFHVRNGRFERIYGVEDKHRDCDPVKDYCTITQVQVDYGQMGDLPVLALVRTESIEQIPQVADWTTQSPQLLEVLTNARRVSCRVLVWNEAQRAFLRSAKWSEVYCGTKTTVSLENP